METKPSPLQRARARELGAAPGVFSPGPLNAISDVVGIAVSHVTLLEGEEIRTGVTALLPHPGNIYHEKVPAAIVVGNGFGKLVGSTQVNELGEIESPILLTNTLAVTRAAEAIIDWTLSRPGNEEVRSVNPVVGETNDGFLNNIRQRAVTVDMALQAIESAAQLVGQPVPEGSVGAGTGTVAFGWKGGIGTSSRRVPGEWGDYTVGVMVQSNFGGRLQIAGVPIWKTLNPAGSTRASSPSPTGSIMILVATDAPLSDRNLKRLARRALAGLARTGASFENGSGDYVIAFSTSEAVRRVTASRIAAAHRGENLVAAELPNQHISPLFEAVIEATEEAIVNSLFLATSVTGYKGNRAQAIPLEQVRHLLESRLDLDQKSSTPS